MSPAPATGYGQSAAMKQILCAGVAEAGEGSPVPSMNLSDAKTWADDHLSFDDPKEAAGRYGTMPSPTQIAMQ